MSVVKVQMQASVDASGQSGAMMAMRAPILRMCSERFVTYLVLLLPTQPATIQRATVTIDHTVRIVMYRVSGLFMVSSSLPSMFR